MNEYDKILCRLKKEENDDRDYNTEEPENIKLSEISELQKGIYRIVPLK